MNLLTLQRIKEDAEILEKRCEVTDEWINGVNIGRFAYRVNELLAEYERLREKEKKKKRAHTAIDLESLSNYQKQIWINGGKKICKYCNKAIYMERDSGMYIHVGWSEVDGMNGLFCTNDMWKNPETKRFSAPLECDEFKEKNDGL